MLAWLKYSVREAMHDQAKFYDPYETGGCLLGYWAKPLEEVVICEIVGPGPNATHSEIGFTPDHEWQTSKIASLYKNQNICIFIWVTGIHILIIQARS